MTPHSRANLAIELPRCRQAWTIPTSRRRHRRSGRLASRTNPGRIVRARRSHRRAQISAYADSALSLSGDLIAPVRLAPPVRYGSIPSYHGSAAGYADELQPTLDRGSALMTAFIVSPLHRGQSSVVPRRLGARVSLDLRNIEFTTRGAHGHPGANICAVRAGRRRHGVGALAARRRQQASRCCRSPYG